MGLIQIRISCLLLLTVHQVVGLGVITSISDFKMNKRAGALASVASEYWVEMGCPSKPGNAHKGKFAEETQKFGVRCCDLNSKCSTPGKCPRDLYTFHQADKICTDQGKRLCDKGEVQANNCCGTGGSCDFHHIWTATISASPTSTNNNNNNNNHQASGDTNFGGGGDNYMDSIDDININMGGATRGGANTMVYRPEAVHSEVCDTSANSKVCSPCTSTSECWHGVGNVGLMEISVPTSRVGFEYVASIWASCTKKLRPLGAHG